MIIKSLRRTSMYASLLGISGALHLGVFQRPGEVDFFSTGTFVWVADLDDIRLRLLRYRLLAPRHRYVTQQYGVHSGGFLESAP